MICSSQALVPIGNTNFPINDNTSSAPGSAINSGWQVNGIGKIIKIVPHPSVLTTLYACSASGGIFISTNSGMSWAPITGSFLPGVQFGCLAIDPANSNIMYAGTGEPTYAQMYGWSGYGVFKTTNGGATWTVINSGMGNLVVADIVLNPDNSQVIVAGTRDGIFKSSDAGSSWNLVVSAPGQYIQQVSKQGAGLNLVAISNTRFYRSTDFGSSWSTSDLDPAFSAGFLNGRIAIAPSNSSVVYAGWVPNSFGNSNNASIYYSTDGGVTFTKKYAFADAVKLVSYDGSGAAGYGWANFFMTVSLTDPNTLWAGGHLIFKSTNNGVNWSPVITQWWCCTHTDIHQLLYDPNNNSRFLNANDGGVFVSTDQGVSWTPLSNGLYCSQYESMGQGNLDPNFVIGGLQDNGIIFNHTDGNYHTYTGGDLTDHMTCDYTNNYNVYTSNTGGKVFNPYNRSQSANLNLPPTVASGSRQSFFISPINPAIAYGWGTNVFRSSNINAYNLAAGTSTVSWTQISTFGTTIRDVKSSPINDDIVYALGNNATLYKSVNATTGSPVFSPTLLPVGASTSVNGFVTVSGLNPNVLYVTANSAVYRSADAGLTWSNYTASGLPAINFQKIFVDPYSTIESVYLITTLGLYYRDLTMTSWISVNPQVVPAIQNNAASFAGLINGTSLYKGAGSSSSHVSFATWGSGIWKATFYNQQTNSLPGAWNSIDIGSPALAGSGTYDNNKHTFNVSGSGTGINSSATDQFNFTKLPLLGNSDIVTKIYTVAETDPVNGLSKTGLMLRSTSNSNSPYVMIALTGHAGAVFQYRVNAGDVATVTTVAPSPVTNYPYWLKLNKANTNVITAYISPDGIIWTQVGQITVNLGTNFLGGIANTSNNAASSNKASTGDVSLNNFGVLAIDNLQLQAVMNRQNKVNLSWHFTSDETSNNVTLEKSGDGTRFSSILQKNYPNSAGSLITISDVSADENPFYGNNYYRLKILQQNGSIKYSNIERVVMNSDLQVKLEPNPVKKGDQLKITIAGGRPFAQIKVELFDMAGQKVGSEQVSTNSHNEISVRNLSAGSYLYRVIYNNKVITGKFVVEND